MTKPIKFKVKVEFELEIDPVKWAQYHEQEYLSEQYDRVELLGQAATPMCGCIQQYLAYYLKHNKPEDLWRPVNDENK